MIDTYERFTSSEKSEEGNPWHYISIFKKLWSLAKLYSTL